ncbi:hypothetical protein CERZMDRAFT_53632 [Cercospora zeae-maydis SCOH1-5]|uniref:DUF6536 domain-containing protein n=1 Tax=Cercospora zeae-maydis SCOH1-5 TaxID=717836 RepID=A0A6A6EWX2_9PEZI|nr:hypothetical protein CERZMDRAFT_53632 [Cercospora zeae-maydis SCOH1-5]
MAFTSTYSTVSVKEEAQVHETDLKAVDEDAAQKSSPHRRWKTWKAGVAASAAICCAVLITNLGLTVAAFLHFSGSMVAGIGTLFQGSCDSVDSWSTGLHVIINILSSAMLSASNYTMQSLAAPTRAEVNKAHATGEHVDIGLLSYRNVVHGISAWRSLGIGILALSSLPIHLLYNSAIFKTIDNNVYGRYFLWINEMTQDYGPSYDYVREKQKWFSENYRDESMMQRLDNADCIAQYGQHYISGHGDVLLITSPSPEQDNRTFLWWGTTDHDRWRGGDWRFERPTALDWVFPGGHQKSIRANPEGWSRNNRIIDYCLAIVSAPKCQLQFTVQILIAVVVCNAIKSVFMLVALFSHKDAPLVTIGDAIASFLETSSMTGSAQEERYISTKNHRWRHTAPARWLATILLCLGGLIAAAVYLAKGLDWQGSGARTRAKLAISDFGRLNPNSIIGSGPAQRGFEGLIGCIILANLPQLICSLLYLAYNGLFTSMLLGAEWSSYYLRHKPLRVSQPTGLQRSTYFLQLPFRYSIPLLIASTVLHWLISQSLFLSRIIVYREGVAISAPGQEESRVAFSCLPILLVIVLGALMLVVAMGMSQRKLKHGLMPFVGSDSRRIERACVAMRGDDGLQEKPLAWGEVDVDLQQQQHAVVCAGAAHVERQNFCGFTSSEVRKPTVDPT